MFQLQAYKLSTLERVFVDNFDEDREYDAAFKQRKSWLYLKMNHLEICGEDENKIALAFQDNGHFYCNFY